MISSSFRASFASAGIGLGLVLLAGLHCGESPTERAPVAFAVALRVQPLERETALGWRVTLERAFAALGPVRWFEAEPPMARFRPRFAWGVALAHPGHYEPGEGLASVNVIRVVDLLAPGGNELTSATGYSGDARSASVGLFMPGGTLGPSAAMLDGKTVRVRGSARRGDTVVYFDGGVTPNAEINGIPARGRLDGGAGRWEVTLDLGVWFERVDFAALPPSSETSYATFAPGNIATTGLYRGVSAPTAWRFAQVAPDRDR